VHNRQQRKEEKYKRAEENRDKNQLLNKHKL
jgi:hypothetical protein